VSDSVEAGPPLPLSTERSRRVERVAKAGRQEPTVGFSRARRFGLRHEGAGGPDGKGGAHPESRNWRRNSLKRFNLRSELVWARQPGSPKIWYSRANIPGCLSPDGRGDE
jgi:hypothetical protein